MIFAGLKVSTDTALGKDIVILASKKEKLVVSFDPAFPGPAYYIKSAIDARGHMVVVEHGELRGDKAERRRP